MALSESIEERAARISAKWNSKFEDTWRDKRENNAHGFNTNIANAVKDGRHHRPWYEQISPQDEVVTAEDLKEAEVFVLLEGERRDLARETEH
jgi:hypothetical protein